MYLYSQSSGQLSKDGVLIGIGYSGHGKGINNPLLESIHNVGPLPKGKWQIGPAHFHGHLGSTVMSLTPISHSAFGRGGFYIHGDNSASNRTASNGCLILNREIRRFIAISSDNSLEVVG